MRLFGTAPFYFLRSWRVWKVGLLLFVLLSILYPTLGYVFVHRIDDNPNFEAGPFTEMKGSASVSMAAALIDREVNRHGWTPNDPFFMPGAWLDRMPAFQSGIIRALSRFALQLSDQLGRVRGSSSIDADLQKAVGLLNYSPDVWVFDFSTSLLPTASSETQYRGALEALVHYNTRLASGEAVFERRADNLMETLDRIASDLGAASAQLNEHIETRSGSLVDTDADRLFYEVKGKMYAYALLLAALEKDFALILEEKQLQGTWDQMLKSLQEGSAINHFFVFNAPTNSTLLANHLAVQGFYLLRARTQLREITNILLK